MASFTMDDDVATQVLTREQEYPAGELPQRHEDVVLDRTWWWAVHISLSVIALVGNVLFLVTVVYNR